MKPEWSTITYLHGAGRSAADAWLAANRTAVGKFESVDLARHFFGRTSASAPPVPVPSRRIAEYEGRTKIPAKRTS